MACFFILAGNTHGGEKLLGDTDLAVAVLALKRPADTKLARMRHTSQIALGIAGADFIQHIAGHHGKIPWLRIHRRRRAHGEGQNFFNQFLRHRVRLITSCATATEDNIIIWHAHARAPIFAALIIIARALPLPVLSAGFLSHFYLYRRCRIIVENLEI